MDESLLKTFAAATDSVLPGSSSAGVHERVISLFDGAMQGFSHVVAGLLDAFASDVRSGASFVDLDEKEREAVIRLMIDDPSVDVRDAADGLLLFTLGQNYVETHPRYQDVYQRIGYRGPSDGHPEYV